MLSLLNDSSSSQGRPQRGTRQFDFSPSSPTPPDAGVNPQAGAVAQAGASAIAVTDQAAGVPAYGPEDNPESSALPANGSDYEFVIGRLQMASLAFIALVLITVFSAVAYYVGRMSSPGAAQAKETKSVPKAEPVALPADASRASKGEIKAAVEPSARGILATPNAAPMFAEPQKDVLYLQLGAVDKGTALIFAEGLRTHNLPAFVGPNPDGKIFRVLIGPLTGNEAYTKAKAVTDALSLTTFPKRFAEQDLHPAANGGASQAPAAQPAAAALPAPGGSSGQASGQAPPAGQAATGGNPQ
jgi:hypothetical protein